MKDVRKKNEVETLFESLSSLRRLVLEHLTVIVADNSLSLLTKLETLGIMVKRLELEGKKKEKSQNDLLESRNNLLKHIKGIAQDVKSNTNLQNKLEDAPTREKSDRETRVLKMQLVLQSLEKQNKEIDEHNANYTLGEEEAQRRKREMETQKFRKAGLDLRFNDDPRDEQERNEELERELKRLENREEELDQQQAKDARRDERIQHCKRELEKFGARKAELEQQDSAMISETTRVKEAHSEICTWVLEDGKTKKEKETPSSVPVQASEVGWRVARAYFGSLGSPVAGS